MNLLNDMKCVLCERKVEKHGEPESIYTGDFYQSYQHIGFDEEWAQMSHEERNKMDHKGFSRKVEKI
jgi:hypothetical protein